MDAPDALTEAVARAIAADPDFDRLAEIYQEGQRLRAKRAMSVPGIADALARDAKVAEIVADFPYGATDSQMVAMAEEVLDAHRWTAP